MHKKTFLILLILVVSLIIFMLNTNPQQVSLGLLLVPFCLIAIIAYVITRYTILVVRKKDKPSAKSIILSVSIAILSVNFLLLRSINQLTLQDVLISFAISAILAFYVTKFRLGYK
jgi:hypothetical protein